MRILNDAFATPGTGTFPSFVSVTLIDVLATVTLVIILAGVALRLFKWRNRADPGFFKAVRLTLGLGSIVRILLSEIINRVALQTDVFFNTDKSRRITHLAMFWGFVGLMVTTTLDFLFNRDGNYIPLIGGTLSPIRLLGNISGVVMMAGATATFAKWIAVPKFRRGRVFWDLWFATLLFLTGLTGFFAEYFGDQAHLVNPNVPPAALYSISLSASPLIIIPYGIHLACVALLLVTAPVSLFIHALSVPSMQYLDRLGKLLTAKNQEKKLQIISDGASEKDKS